jgi:hypothetical protein
MVDSYAVSPDFKGVAAIKIPHPNPLPGGEGTRTGRHMPMPLAWLPPFLFPLSPRERVRVRDLYSSNTFLINKIRRLALHKAL